MAECRDCVYYERIPKRRVGYCRNPESKYYELQVQGSKKPANYCFSNETIDNRMTIIFKLDIENREIHYIGKDYCIAQEVDNIEEIAEFAKDIIEHDITIPNFKHKENVN